MKNDRNILKSEKGVGLIEILFSILLIAVAAGGILSHTVLSLNLTSRLELDHAAHALALSKMELLSSVNTSELDASDNSTESGLVTPGISTTFSRTTTIVVGADNSRLINVTVANEGGRHDISNTFTTTWAVWE
jgi:Tfp pilus assembly protein PilV